MKYVKIAINLVWNATEVEMINVYNAHNPIHYKFSNVFA